MPKIAEPSRKVSVVDPASWVAKAREFLALKQQSDGIKTRMDSIKKDLLVEVATAGEEVDGHQWLDLPEPVDGYVSLKRERRVKRGLDEGYAESVLREKGLYDKCVKTVEVIDEDAVFNALYLGLLTEDEVDGMFPPTVTYAFVPSRKGRD